VENASITGARSSRALAHVHVLVGVQHVVGALGAPEDLERQVGDHLVGVHVGRGAGAALDDVDDELVVMGAVAQRGAGGDDGVAALAVEQPELAVGQRRRLLDAGKRADQLRVGRDRRAGDREVLHRAQGVHAPVGCGGHLAVAQQVVFGPSARCLHGVLVRLRTRRLGAAPGRAKGYA
jgi:hypothetical protein